MSNKKRCSDCDGSDLGSIYDKGDCKCSNCHGTGKISDIGSVATEMFTFGAVEAEEDCDECSGTGQCQTCGGTGFEKDDEGDENEED